MEKYVKFLRKLPKFLAVRLVKTLDRIATDDLKNLDVKLLKGSKNIYRCRVGKIRIIFEKRPEGNIIHDIGFRGNIY